MTASSALRILVVNGDLAPHDRDSGSLRLFRLLQILAQEGHQVTFVGRCGVGQERTAAELTACGIDVFPVDPARMRELGFSIAGPELDWPELLASGRFDVALLSFYDVAEQYLPLIRTLSPLTRIVIDTVDVHHVRERRGAELSGDPAALRAAERTRAREHAIYNAADALIAVSDADAAALRELAPAVPLFVVSNVHLTVGATPGFAERDGIVFVGNFVHVPNVDAVLDFHRRVWPMVRKRLAGARLTVVGTKPPESVLALRAEDVEVTGWVPEVAPYIDRARVSIAPLRYGAGVKGKIGEALSRGLPVVTTSIGAEGMDLRGGEQVLVADRAEEFAAAVVRLHEERDLWEALRRAGREHIENRLGADAAREAVRALLAGVARTPFVLCATADGLAQAIDAYAGAFSTGDPASLVLTVPAGDSAAAHAAFAGAAAILQDQGRDPDAVADIQIAGLPAGVTLPGRAVRVGVDGSGTTIGPDAPAARWRELAMRAIGPRRLRSAPRAAVVLHPLDDPAVVRAQLNALEQADLPGDVELIVVADAVGAETASQLRSLGDARVIRGTGQLGRREVWTLGAHATSADFVIAVAPLALPAPGFAEALIEPLRDGAAIAGPCVAGAAGLRMAGDGSLWPRQGDSDGTLDALPFDCLAASRELILAGVPELRAAEGPLEAQLARWAVAHGAIVLAHEAHCERVRARPATVIVCTRNRAEELPECVALLLRSGVRDVVIVDDESTDETRAVAEELARRSHGAVRAIGNPDRGLCGARNAGAAAARHDLLLFVDDDARPAPGWLEHLTWTLSRRRVVQAGGPICALWPDERPAGWPGAELEPLMSILDLGDAERILMPPQVVYGANWAVRREALNAVGGFDPGFGPGPEARIGSDEVSVAWRLHRDGVGATAYSPWAAVGHKIAPERIGEPFVLRRALEVGIEQPRIADALGQATPARLIAGAEAAGRHLLGSGVMSGELSVDLAYERIAHVPGTLADRVQLARCLGELAASAALLGEHEVLLGGARLRIEPGALLRGIVAMPAGAAA